MLNVLWHVLTPGDLEMTVYWCELKFKSCFASIHPLTKPLILSRVAGMLELIPAVTVGEAGYTGDRLSIYHIATHRDRQLFMLTLTPMGNLTSQMNLTCMFLDCGSYRENMQTSTQKGPRLPEGIQTHDLPAVRPKHSSTVLPEPWFLIIETIKRLNLNYKMGQVNTTVYIQLLA